MKRTALVVGATGLVGHSLLQRLLRDPAYGQVRALSRRPLGLRHDHLQLVQTDFRNLAALGDALQVQDVFCCLGTTRRKAGSRAAFEDVDYRMVVELAQATRAAGAHQFIVVSAVGASRHAAAFYSRVKGRMEAAVSVLGFDAVHVVRPSLLLGERDESRPGEALAQKLAPALSPLLVGPLKRYRPVDADEVAEAMVRVALGGQAGVHIHHLPLA
jgi:uncharacterized protein YbjT (DUF2867 family)